MRASVCLVLVAIMLGVAAAAGVDAELHHNKTNIAICALSKSQTSWKHISQIPPVKYLIKSIYNTTRLENSLYNIRVLIGVDVDDMFWIANYENITLQVRRDYGIDMVVKFYRHVPGYLPFNLLMQDAWNTQAEYLVRMNDDSEFKSEGWITLAINVLRTYEPPNVGVVGPTCSQGKTTILTHDMVHRTHLRIFQTYYPPIFHNWYIDDWISSVYGPSRTKKVDAWVVEHHVHLGTRYNAMQKDEIHLTKEILKGGKTIQRYLANRHVLDRLIRQ